MPDPARPLSSSLSSAAGVLCPAHIIDVGSFTPKMQGMDAATGNAALVVDDTRARIRDICAGDARVCLTGESQLNTENLVGWT
jgi:hypothetical protein